MKTEYIKLTYESLIALIQGRELHVRNTVHDTEFIFIPPMDGVFVTHHQLNQMRYIDQMGVLNLLKELKTHTQEG